MIILHKLLWLDMKGRSKKKKKKKEGGGGGGGGEREGRGLQIVR